MSSSRLLTRVLTSSRVALSWRMARNTTFMRILRWVHFWFFFFFSFFRSMFPHKKKAKNGSMDLLRPVCVEKRRREGQQFICWWGYALFPWRFSSDRCLSRKSRNVFSSKVYRFKLPKKRKKRFGRKSSGTSWSFVVVICSNATHRRELKCIWCKFARLTVTEFKNFLEEAISLCQNLSLKCYVSLWADQFMMIL